MHDQPVFISHASKDDAFVKELRHALEARGLRTWVDSRELVAGNTLAPEIEQAIETARQFIVVLSPNTINSPWVRKEILKALEVQQRRAAEGYRVIPLLLPGVEPGALLLWFDEEPVGVRVRLGPGGVSESLGAILAALGERLPEDPQPVEDVESQPVEELILKLSGPNVEQRQGKRHVTATATLIYEPADRTVRDVESEPFDFSAPLGPIEADDLRWYLERYHQWPVGIFQERARWIEARLPEWGRLLYRAMLAAPETSPVLEAWRGVHGAEQRFSVLVDSAVPPRSRKQRRINAQIAASDLLALPWELLHDGRGYLFQGKHAARIRRRLPNRRRQLAVTTNLPIRVLLVSPRPEDQYARYFDHRSSALPLVEAVESLGELVELEVLAPPTFAALKAALKQAADAGNPFDVVHFDGHGVYDPEHGLGGLCFENPRDLQKIVLREMEFVDAKDLAAEIRDYRIPLVFLDACQTARVEDDPTASVAARLLEEGVTSVVAMSHSVLVATARRFVGAFYASLAHGARVGAAMLAGQHALYDDTYRLKIMGAGELHLQDWFVPVLYQEQHDPQLITRLLPDAVQQLQAQQRRLSMGELPAAPPHQFQGRSRELLALERLLHREQYAMLRGQGGAGKTTLAVELARWLVRTNRFKRAAFASVEQSGDARTVLDAIGRQLVPSYSVAQYADLKQALQPVERALRDSPTLIVLDNLESVLPDASGQSPAAAPLEELFALCQALLAAHTQTRLLFTSREALPAPFDHRGRMVELGALSREDAIELVSQVMAQEGLTPVASDPGGTAEEITDLVEAVNRHARALVLLAREVARRGVRATTDNLRQLMAELERKHPGDRENSLYASVELSLRRLTPEQRSQVRKLGVFHGGGRLENLAHVMGLDVEAARTLGAKLIDVGLAEDMGYGHLRLDAALPSYLLSQLNEEEEQEGRERWGEGMIGLTGFLYEQRFQDVRLAAQLTLLELPNLLALLEWTQEKLSSGDVVQVVGWIEEVLGVLDRPQALTQVVAMRKKFAQKLGEWGHAQFETKRLEIERLLQRGDVQAAYQATQQLLQRSLDEGETAYQGAKYDLAMAYNLAGQALAGGGAAEEALDYYVQAQQMFQVLADAGDSNAQLMISVVMSGSAQRLALLGRLADAVTTYKMAIQLSEKLNDSRGVAVKKSNLGNVRLQQGYYKDALQAYEEARNIFTEIGEPKAVAGAWHQIGRVYTEMRQLDQAEYAYRQSLIISVQQKDFIGEARTSTALAVLYAEMGQLEGAVNFVYQAVNIFHELHIPFDEGVGRSNLANILIKLQRYDDARRELQRAIECKQLYGHAAEPWKTWAILYDLEKVMGNPEAAAQARHRAIESYAAYRRAGGESRNAGARLCGLVFQAIQQGQMDEVEQFLAQYLERVKQHWTQAMIPKLQAILKGDRDPALADDPDLGYTSAAELQLLLEALNGAAS